MTGCYGITAEDRDKERALDRYLDRQERGKCPECGARLEPDESDENGRECWMPCKCEEEKE